MALVLSLLGPVHVTLDGGVLEIGGPRGRRVLAALALEAGRVVPMAGLAEAVWDDPPATARQQLQNAAGLLRRRVANAGASVVRTDAGFLLDPGGAVLDVREFARLRTAAHAVGEPAGARLLLGRALELWQGPVALGGLRGRIFEAAAARLAQDRLDCVERALAADIALGRHAEVCPELAALCAEHPLRERLVELHVLALYRSGRRAEALAAFDSARRRLAREAGLDPGPDLRALHAAVLADAAALRGCGPWSAGPQEVPVDAGGPARTRRRRTARRAAGGTPHPHRAPRQSATRARRKVPGPWCLLPIPPDPRCPVPHPTALPGLPSTPRTPGTRRAPPPRAARHRTTRDTPDRAYGRSPTVGRSPAPGRYGARVPAAPLQLNCRPRPRRSSGGRKRRSA
ncbi:AfsR/SARP family transcriptional regulator [Streptomyces sp. NRRL S-448]|uniref:AfsR/SARP family transcriptional regulator n=1 Tax=Streptomyces sp. NRRL S-448 TaxID=1463907 RepID=UPI0035617E7E